MELPEREHRAEERCESMADRIGLLQDELKLLERRLAQVESSRVFRILKWMGLALDSQKKRAGQRLLHSPLHPLYLKLRGVTAETAQALAYRRWVERTEALFQSVSWHRTQAAQWRFQPVVSILMPTYNPERTWLESAIASVTAQSYGNWQLCIYDDGSASPWIREFLEAQAAADLRIHVVFGETNLGISGALNQAGRWATGDYLAFLDHDDELHPYALHYVVEALQEDEVDLVYTDEDHLNLRGERFLPAFKPDWSPELLDSCMYVCHLLVVARQLVDRVGWFRSFCDGSQDYDLMLRVCEQARKIRHVRRVLYHWRQHSRSASLSTRAKPYTHAAGRRALEDSLLRRGVDGKVEDGPLLNMYYVRRKREGQRVSVIVCSRKPALLKSFVRTLSRTRYADLELVVVAHLAESNAAMSSLLDRLKCVCVPYYGAFNFSAMNNLGARAASSRLLVFLNDDVSPLRADWLEVMAAHLERPEVGIVGGRLLFPNGAIQHSGMALGMLDGVGHPGRHSLNSDPMYYLALPHNVSAVTGACLGIRRDLFESLGGFDESFAVNYNDVDLCLRVAGRGLSVLVDPRVEMTHRECQTRQGGTTLAERLLFRERWRKLLAKPDPYYPEAYDRTTEEVRLAIP